MKVNPPTFTNKKVDQDLLELTDITRSLNRIYKLVSENGMSHKAMDGLKDDLEYVCHYFGISTPAVTRRLWHTMWVVPILNSCHSKMSWIVCSIWES